MPADMSGMLPLRLFDCLEQPRQVRVLLSNTFSLHSLERQAFAWSTWHRLAVGMQGIDSA